MKYLYLLERVGTTDYEEFDAFVVRASSSSEARALASRMACPNPATSHKPQEAEVWLNPAQSHITRLGQGAGKSTVILGSNRGA